MACLNGCPNDYSRAKTTRFVISGQPADFTFTNNGCFNDPVAFFDNSNTAGRPIINRYWNFGDLTTSALNNPTHLYAAPGAYLVKYAIITDVGCLSDTGSHVVTVNPLPTASISGTTAVCLNATSPDITFTGANGVAPYTFSYNINGGPNQTVVSVGNTITVSVPTNVAGTFIYYLVSVQNGTVSPSTNLQTGSAAVTVNPARQKSLSGKLAGQSTIKRYRPRPITAPLPACIHWPSHSQGQKGSNPAPFSVISPTSPPDPLLKI